MDIKHIPTELAAHPEGSFLDITSFNGNSIGACRVSGESPVWEMHPDTDEFFYILDGEFQVTLLTDEGPVTHTAGAGCTFVVPRGIWHKPAAPEGASFMYLTPGTSLHSDAEDPRQQ